MWKRLSKSSTGVTSDDKAKRQAADPSDLGSSTTVATKKVAISSSTIQESVPSTQGQTDETAESPTGQDIPPSQDVSGQQSTAPKKDESTSAESPAHLHPDSTISPSVIPRADHAEAPTNPSSSEARPQDAPSSSIPRSVVNAPTVANTLSVPGPESSNVPTYARRLSFRSLAFFYGRDNAIPPNSNSSHTPVSRMQGQSKSNTLPQPRLSRSEKQAYFSAITLRTLMIGSTFPPPPSETTTILKLIKFPNSKSTAALPLPDIKKVKGQLLKPESANAIISQLRHLPIPDGPSFHVSGHASSDSFVTHPVAGGAPIHAVCLPCTDEEAEKTYFLRLRTGHNLSTTSNLSPDAKPAGSSPNIAVASLESLISVLRDLHLVSLLESPDLGFGQPVNDGNSGPLTGSVPSAETVMEGFEEITVQLMNLGFATSSAVLPSHAGIYPPTDRMSVLTYWWGLELVLPEPSIQFLSKVKSISNTLLNFLSALALFNNGVREALPFIRYVANFVDFEWSAIRAQDKGKGVVCAATWVMPAAMVPRPWDFAPRPKASPGAPASPEAPKPSAGNNDKSTEGTGAPAQPAPSPKASPGAPASPEAPKPSAGNNDKSTEGTGTPAQPAPSEGSNPSEALYPVAPSMPMMPQLLVTPATLHRSTPVPQEETAT